MGRLKDGGRRYKCPMTISLSVRQRLRSQLLSLVPWTVLVLTMGMVLSPVLLILLHSFEAGEPSSVTTYNLNSWRLVLSDSKMLSVVWNTIALTVARHVVSFPTAILLAWILARTDIPGSGWLEFLFWVAFFLPTLPVILGWIILLDPDRGLLNQWITRLPFVDKGPFNIYSFWGIVWAHLGTNAIAIKVMLLTSAFRNMDATLEEASRVSGATVLGTLARVVVPIMTPVLLVVLLLSVIYSLHGFEVELILGFPFRFFVYSTQIYLFVHQDPPILPPAMTLSSIILVVMLPIIVMNGWISRRRRYTTVTGHFKGHKVRLHKWRTPVFLMVLGIAMTITVIPFIFLMIGTFMKLFGYFNLVQPWTTVHWIRVLNDPIFLSSIRNTLVLALGTALTSVIVSTIIAYIVMRTSFVGRTTLDFMSWLPATIPGIILGLGLLGMILRSPIFSSLYGTMPILVIAVAIGRMTIGVQMIRSNFAQLSLELEEAALVSGGSRWNAFRRILLPIMAPTLMLVGALSFILAARDVSTVALLATSDTRPLALLQMDFMFTGVYERAAVVGVVVVALSTGVALIARAFIKESSLHNY